MRIHATQAGKIIVIFFLIGVGIFFMCGGAAVVAKLIENHRVGAFATISDRFSNSDISYTSWNTLKSSFSARYAKISDDLGELKKLQESYPKNEELKSKIQNYQAYLDSMKEASFDCPEHINTGTERRYRTCSNCNGKGTRYIFWTCKECNGNGNIGYNVSISRNCPHCGTNYKSQIPAKSLLN